MNSIAGAPTLSALSVASLPRALQFTVVLLVVLWMSAPSDVAAQSNPRVVDGLTLSSPAEGDTFKRGETITVTVNWNLVINNQATCQTASNPLRLVVQIGSTNRDFRCPGGNAIYSRNHPFSYVVQAADLDPDGISIAANAIMGGTWWAPGFNSIDTDIGTNAITNSANHKVDASQFPTGASGVTGVALNTPVLAGTFERGEAIEVTLTFNVAVDVTGTPQVGLGIGSNTRQAAYVSGTGTTALVFRYTVVSADWDSNGVSIAADALGLNSGTIRTGGTTTNTMLGLGLLAITDSGDHVVDGSTLTATAVSDVEFTSTPASGDAYYRLGELLQVRVTFNRPVNLVTTGGSPSLALTIGTQTRQTNQLGDVAALGQLVFSYTVAAGDFDDDGISVAAGALSLNGGQINDARSATMPATLGLGTHAITNDAAHKVAAPPVVTANSLSTPQNNIIVTAGMTSSGADGTFELGKPILVTVTFNQAVNVSGTPQVTLGIDSGAKQAVYVSGSGTTSLIFRYTVVAADSDSDGISIASTALTLNGGTITSALLSLDADLTLTAINNDPIRKVDGGAFTAATTTTIPPEVTSNPVINQIYGLGERIAVSVWFRGRVTVTGTPLLALTIGTATRQAEYDNIFYNEDFDWSFLTFHYIVQGASSGGSGGDGEDLDADGISVAADALTLNGGAINDARDATASVGLVLTPLANDALHTVNAGPSYFRQPTVAGVTVQSMLPAGAAYGTDDEILVRVSFNRAVAVTGSPTLTLMIGSSRRQAQYESGSGTLDLLFRYVVEPADVDADGFGVPEDALSLNGGRIVLAGSTMAALLDLGSHTLENAGRVAGTPRSGVPGTPSATQTPPFVLVPAGEDAEVDLSPLFVDPEGDALTYSASSNDPNVATATVEGSTLRISGGGRAGETTVSVTATDPGGLAASVVIRVEVVGTEAACSTAPAEAPEGGKATAVVELVSVAGVSTTVRWHLASDADPATADADAGDHGGVSGEVQVRAGERCAEIEIDILDDDDAEPAREWFNVVLRGGQLARATIPVAILEGVCDRTPAVRRALLAATDAAGCEVPAAADLHRVGELTLAEARLDALAAEDFSDLTGLRTLDLAGNGLTELPALPALVRLERLLLPGNALEAVPLAALPAPERLRELILSDNALSELPANALAAAPGLRSLRLDGNRLETLPEGVFAGLGSLRLLRLDDNPGAPFTVRVNLERVDAQPWASAPAMLRAAVPLGAPFEFAVGLTAEGATFADGGTASEATVAGGQTAGHAVAVYAAGGFARVALTVPGLPDRQCLSGPCWQGFALEAGAPLTLFARRVLGDEPVPLFGEDLRVSLSSLAEAGGLSGDLEWSVRSTAPALATVAIDGDALLVEPALGAEGDLRVEATATDASGQTTTVYFDVYVEFHWPTRSWREIITNEQR